MLNAAVLLPLIFAVLAAPVAVIAGASRPAYAAPVGMTFAALATLATLWGWLTGGGTIDVAWVPNWGLRFTLSLDGLAAMYALLATGIGFALGGLGALAFGVYPWCAGAGTRAGAAWAVSPSATYTRSRA